MKKLLQINPVLRVSTSTGRIMQEIGELALRNGWESYVAYGRGRDGVLPCKSRTVPVGGWWSTAWHGLETRLLDRHGLASTRATRMFVRQIEGIRPDIVHIHNLHGYFLDYRVLFDYLSRSGIPVVWTVLYALMGIASYLASASDAEQEEKRGALWAYGIQLAFNFLWPIVFFNLKWYFFAFLWLVMLWALILITLLRFGRIRRLSGQLLIPYLLWVAFAGYLNLGVWLLN